MKEYFREIGFSFLRFFFGYSWSRKWVVGLRRLVGIEVIVVWVFEILFF